MGRRKYIASAIVLIGILIIMTIKPMGTEILGDEILIQTKAYDPRDIFRGDYISLNYEISEVSKEKVDKDILNKIRNHKMKDNEKLYVSLIKEKNYYKVKNVTFTKPIEDMYMFGKYAFNIYDKEGNTEGIRIRYTLDRYYVPENEGKEIEKKVRAGEALARIKIYKGYALLKEIVY